MLFLLLIVVWWDVMNLYYWISVQFIRCHLIGAIFSKIFQEPTCRFIPANTVYMYLGAHIRRKEGCINHCKFPSYHKHNCHKKRGD